MQIFYDIASWQAFRSKLSPSLRLGFVPTMGNLHQGHASLYQKSLSENDVTVASLFINPTQFNQIEDFNKYPRTLEEDLALLQELGVHYCLLPQKEEIYADNYRYKIIETELCQLMEGKHRPGHFEGMLTIVLKLLHLVRAHKAYFGEKDYQQYLLIKGMAEAFFIDTVIEPCPTIRDVTSGLALSSRNNRLTPEELGLAGRFARIAHRGNTPLQIQKNLEEEGIKVDYVFDYEGRRFVAVVIGGIRLIDNWELETAEP